MPTIQERLAHLPAHHFAISFGAKIDSVVFERGLAKSALLLILFSLVLLAVLAKVVGFCFALDAEVVAAIGTPDSELAHMMGSSFGNEGAVVLLHLNDLPLHHFDHIAALTLYQVVVILQNLPHYLIVQFVILFLA